MPFYLYQREEKLIDGTQKECFKMIRKVKLAGYNAIYNLWIKKGKPLNQGWHITLDELIKEVNGGTGDSNTHRLIIDFDPNATWRIGLVEVLDIYIYTYGNGADTAIWSPIMLRLRDVLYEEKTIDLKNKGKKIAKFCIDKRPFNNDDIFEFLYLQGEEKGWNWGGRRVNAPFIHKEAREFFKKFFCK